MKPPRVLKELLIQFVFLVPIVTVVVTALVFLGSGQ